MRPYFFKVFIILFCLAGCQLNDPQLPVAFVQIFVSSTVAKDKLTVGGATLSVFKLFYGKMRYTSAATIDSLFTNASLKGADLILMNFDSSDFEIRIDSSYVPNGRYSSLTFNIERCSLPDSIQGMNNKSIEIEGTLGNKPFRFWHNDTTIVKTYFPDSLLAIVKGAPHQLQVYVDFDKALDPQLGGVDLSTATDGNQDGLIAIDPDDLDGNAALADDIFKAVVKNISCKRKN